MEKIENHIKLCRKINNIVYNDIFYSISKLNKLINSNERREFDFYFKGLNQETEKKILAICPKKIKDNKEKKLNFPIKFFKIINKSKFKDLEHKHYLGTILSLGIKREVLGDLIVKNGVCYGIIKKNMLDFLIENILKINSSPVEISEIEENEIPKSEFEDLQITLTSLRLDSLISELTNLSRNAATSYIDIGNIQINYEVCREKNFKLKEGDIITIRKYGKYIIGEERGFTKKSKLKISIKKYI